MSGSFQQVNALHYQVTVRRPDDFIGTGTVSVANGAFTDTAGNPGVSGSDTVTINTDNDLVGTLSGLTGGNAVEAKSVQVATLFDGGLNVIGDTTTRFIFMAGLKERRLVSGRKSPEFHSERSRPRRSTARRGKL